VKIALEKLAIMATWAKWQEETIFVQGVGHASSGCQADFFTFGANSMIFPRCSGETHFALLRMLLGM